MTQELTLCSNCHFRDTDLQKADYAGDSLYLKEVDCLVHNVLLLSDGGGAPGAALGCLLEWHDGHFADSLASGGQAGVERGHADVCL